MDFSKAEKLIAFNMPLMQLCVYACILTVSWPKNLYRALDYIIYSDDKKMLSFNASDGLMKLLCKIAEQYVELQLDQKFSSLDYYKTMLTM